MKDFNRYFMKKYPDYWKDIQLKLDIQWWQGHGLDPVYGEKLLFIKNFKCKMLPMIDNHCIGCNYKTFYILFGLLTLLCQIFNAGQLLTLLSLLTKIPQRNSRIAGFLHYFMFATWAQVVCLSALGTMAVVGHQIVHIGQTTNVHVTTVMSHLS